jgi:hypothetical protein
MSWTRFYFYWLPPLIRQLQVRWHLYHLHRLMEERWKLEARILDREERVVELDQLIELDERQEKEDSGVDARE